MTTFLIPTLKVTYELSQDIDLIIRTQKENINFLSKLNILPGCASLKYWKNNQNVFSLTVNLKAQTKIQLLDLNYMKNSAKIHIWLTQESNYMNDIVLIDWIELNKIHIVERKPL